VRPTIMVAQVAVVNFTACFYRKCHFTCIFNETSHILHLHGITVQSMPFFTQIHSTLYAVFHMDSQYRVCCLFTWVTCVIYCHADGGSSWNTSHTHDGWCNLLFPSEENWV